jgi:5-methylcytosine-specific restriction endonuclease McrA
VDFAKEIMEQVKRYRPQPPKAYIRNTKTYYTSKHKPSIKKDIRETVLKRDNYCCTECGIKNDLHIHHIEYRSNGGMDDIENLITLCRDCHTTKHRKEPVFILMKARTESQY